MIAVTGANGLLGSFIVRALAEKHYRVLAVMRQNSGAAIFSEFGDQIVRRDADILDVPALMAALQGAQAVVHTAATVSFDPRKAKKIIDVNVEGTGNVVDVCLELGIPRLIHVSSVAAIGRQKDLAYADEESKWIESDLNSDYSISKYLAELQVFRGKEEGLNVSMVNPSVILAPADWTKSSAQLFKYAWDEKRFYTEGTLNYVDVRDVADMVMLLLAGDHNGQKFIANGGTISCLGFFTAIASRFGKRPPSVAIGDPWAVVAGWVEETRGWLTGREPLVTRHSARLALDKIYYSNEKAKKELGVNFRTLAESLDWCCDAYLRKINTNK